MSDLFGGTSSGGGGGGGGNFTSQGGLTGGVGGGGVIGPIQDFNNPNAVSNILNTQAPTGSAGT